MGSVFRRRSFVVFGVFAAAGLALAPMAGASSLPGTGGQDELNADGIPVWNDEFIAIDQDLQSLGIYTDFAGTFSGSVFDRATMTFTVRYYEGALDNDLDEFFDRMAELDHSGDITIETAPVDYDVTALGELAQEISANAEWADIFEVDKIVGAAVDEPHAGILVYTWGEAPTGVVFVGAVPVRFEGGVRVSFQNRSADSAPFTGGDTITTSSGGGSVCTMGFVWRKWGTSERLGGGAEHCYTATGDSTWWNGSTFVGTRAFGNASVDSMLLRSSPTSTFQPRVWVGGGPTTSVWRPVTGAIGTPSNGAVVALSGAVSSAPGGAPLVGNNISNNHYYGGIGPFTETTVTGCLDGDSGAPWLTTTTSAEAIAHGQHGGLVYHPVTGDPWRCFYMPVVNTSAALAASILIAP
jgi:hypothetical protein